MTATARLRANDTAVGCDTVLPGIGSGALLRAANAGPARIVAVTSGKGGVGKSHVALYLAAGAASWGQRVLLIDADVGLASQDLLVGARPRHGLGQVVRGEVALEHAVVEVPGGLELLASPVGDPGLMGMSDGERRNLVDAVDAMAWRYDLVVIDTGAGVAGDALPLSAACDEVVVVTTPEPTALRDAYAVIKLLNQRWGEDRFSLAVNSVRDTLEGVSVHRRLSAVASRFLPVYVEYLGSLPKDDGVPAAVMRGEPLYLTAPRSPFAAAARGLATRLLQKERPQRPRGAHHFLSRQRMGGAEQ